VNADCIKLPPIKAVNHNQLIDNGTASMSEISIIVPAISRNASSIVMLTPYNMMKKKLSIIT
jgi:hypothetical protein